MCDLGGGHDHGSRHFGYLVDAPEIRALIGEAQRLMSEIRDDAARVEALKTAFGTLLGAEGWLPDACARPDGTSRMGQGIGQYALYRAEDGSLCLFSLVVPAGAETPVHDHLAWGLVGIYRGRQDEIVYRRLDDGRDPARADLEVTRRQTLERGEFYPLLPPKGRHPLREDCLGDGLCLDPPAGQRHGLRVAPSLRARIGRRHAVSVGLCERAVSRRNGYVIISSARPSSSEGP